MARVRTDNRSKPKQNKFGDNKFGNKSGNKFGNSERKPNYKAQGPKPSVRPQGEDRNNEERELPENITIGRNPVLEAIKAERTIEKLFVIKGSNEGSIRKILALAKEKGIVIVEADAIKLNSLSFGQNHQGIVAMVSPYKYVEIDDILLRAERRGQAPLVIILDEIQDPHNLGSIMRSAEALGAHGIIIPKRRSVGLTPVVAKASAGAIEYVPVAKVPNLSQAIEYLKKKGLWIAAADMHGKPCYKEDLRGPMAIVIGSEGEGVSRLILENSDYLIKIPMAGKITSLNASVAASVILYEIFKQRIAEE